ncbi:hypothetical protein SAMN05421784_1499 [Xenorhabdus koppenhoeferi]|uniref:Uncharacterized protein n=1 Tax=Xenorhabdus koppenhoeferi TaxID=351659 RepID=A0A1I7K816_9GAMM|nr:hypothetical protein SAMN05421784_1499 [Xenorhabdus koppenhoeferi]
MKFRLISLGSIYETENQKTNISVGLSSENDSHHSFSIIIDKCECDVRNMSFNEIEYLAIRYLKDSLNDEHCHHHHHG